MESLGLGVNRFFINRLVDNQALST